MTAPDTRPLNADRRRRIADALGATPTKAVELDGGMVGSVYRVEFRDHSPVAVKIDDTPLEVEARMLRYLARKSPVPVPSVLHVDSDLLIQEYVSGDSHFDATVERDVADHLAALHEVSADAFGFPFETLSGPYWQPNPWRDSWIEFFRDYRLLHFAELAHEEETLPGPYYRRIESLATRLDELLIEPESPSLVHGDVWTANLIVEDGRVKAMLDPAIYYAHDELELAYVDRVDAFGEPFVERYRHCRGIEEGFFETRRHVYAAFHALENVRFFGSELLGRLDETLSQIPV